MTTQQERQSDQQDQHDQRNDQDQQSQSDRDQQSRNDWDQQSQDNRDQQSRDSQSRDQQRENSSAQRLDRDSDRYNQEFQQMVAAGPSALGGLVDQGVTTLASAGADITREVTSAWFDLADQTVRTARRIAEINSLNILRQQIIIDVTAQVISTLRQNPQLFSDSDSDSSSRRRNKNRDRNDEDSNNRSSGKKNKNR